ncbi:hypothetical protein [Pedobacter frigiditerrae]|uniref:hypothetical protein n=1 Tax=Pedobacter frigiditerrae TaxID=2530452 RepID=UPI00292E5F6D|nr:hypothetical protein [Pedobacter frigiditerrae]
MKTRIMYIKHKEDLTGNAKIGRVTFSKTGKSIHYDVKTFQTLNGSGFKENYFDIETGDYYWISGCKKDGGDRLYGERLPIYIDEDVREEYWIEIRNLPNQVDKKVINGR